MRFDDIVIPDDQLPSIEELPEDLRIMAEIVGVKNAILIALRFAGTYIRCGGVKQLLRRHRDNMIREANDQGETALSLARTHFLDPRTVEKILKKPDMPFQQPTLW